jgi:hypothetical protein
MVTDYSNPVIVGYNRKYYCQKWAGFVWFLIELNLMSANIFGFSALSKVLPKYGIYSQYCKPSNGTYSTELDCSGQTKQYQVNIKSDFVSVTGPQILFNI